jgi:hypothetical protein
MLSRFVSTGSAATLVLIAALAAAPAQAQLLGTSVTGSLIIPSASPTNNYFDPVNGFVPAGPLNTAGTTVVIATPAVEFGYNDGINNISANFTGTQLTLTDVATISVPTFTMTFTNTAFVGKTLSEASDNFAGVGGVTGSLVGNTLTITYPGTPLSATFVAVFNIVAAPVAPEPGTLALLGVACLPMLGVLRRRAAK